MGQKAEGGIAWSVFVRTVRITKSNGNTALRRVAMRQKPGVAVVGKKRLSRRRDSMTELDKAIKFLREQYERAKRIEFIHNPLAWALYQTWRHVDEPPKEG
jgi:hypothetical protein